MGDQIDNLQRGINHTLVNQKILKAIGEEAMISSANILKDIADNLQVPERVIVNIIKNLKHKTFWDMKKLTREVINQLLRNPNTLNYVEELSNLKKDGMRKKHPNRFFVPS